jgi:CubicO group peptidase (beta-lactamase class C family)
MRKNLLIEDAPELSDWMAAGLAKDGLDVLPRRQTASPDRLWPGRSTRKPSFRIGCCLSCLGGWPALRGVFFALLWLWLALAQAPAQGKSPLTTGVNTARIDAFIQDTITRYRIPGLAVSVVKDGQMLFSKGYGQAGQGRPVTPQTQFYLGSVSKSFTALAVMQLVEQGKLELDAPVQRYLSWFQVADAAASSQITVRHLLNHTSGLNESADPGVTRFSPTLVEQVRQMRRARLTAPVGRQYQYDSQNYRVLSLLVETASGQPFDEYLNENIFSRLGMDHSAGNPAQAPDLAQGHSSLFGFPFARRQPFQPAGLGSGYLISSAEDLGKYMLAMLDRGAGLVQPGAYQQIMTPPAGIDSEYGMGWVVTTSTDGYRIIYHGGALANFDAFVIMLPDENLGLAFLSNQNGIFSMLFGHQVLRQGLLDLLVGDTPAPSPSYDWVYTLLVILILVDLGSQLYRTLRLPGWLKKVSQKPALKRWLSLLPDLAIPLLLLVGMPVFGNVVMNSSSSWPEAYDLLPDVTLWIIAGSLFSLGRGMARLALVLRSRG